MGRFLILFSYIGTHYRGLQIQRQAGEVITSIKTVQGVLEEHLHKLKMVNEVMLKTSSRTDSNVHGLLNTCHVDLVHRNPSLEFNPQWITSKLNKSLSRANEKLRILNTVRVADDFSSRIKASERSYVYRMAVVKTPNVFTDPSVNGLPWTAQDYDFTALVYAPLNMDLFLKAAELLSGTHNFKSFTTKNFYRSGRQMKPHTCLSIHVQRGKAWMEEERPEVAAVIDHWDVHFHGLSFLYKQVRRMMGAMVMVGQGKMSVDLLQHCLDNPSLNNPGLIQGVPGKGLTLKRVSYREHELNFSAEAQGKAVEEEYSDSQDYEASPRLKETIPKSTTVTAPTTVDVPSPQQENCRSSS